MTRPELGGRFFESTRGRVVPVPRRGARTVEELAREMRLTDNATRSHLTTLERDGLVRQRGVRRGPGAGKPADIYELHPAALSLFSRALAPVLRAVLDELDGRMTPIEARDAMLGVGRRLAPAFAAAARGLDNETDERPDHARRAQVALAVLAELGGVGDVEPHDTHSTVRGCGDCPLGSVVSTNPGLCRVVESLLSAVSGAEARPVCSHGERPSCAFDVRAVA